MTVAALATVFTLAACATGPAYSDLERAATAEDAWPIELPAHASEGLDAESSRLVAHDGATALYLATASTPDADVCLLVYPDTENWVVGCGTDGMSLGGGGNSSYIVRSDGALTGSTALSANVYLG